MTVVTAAGSVVVVGSLGAEGAGVGAGGTVVFVAAATVGAPRAVLGGRGALGSTTVFVACATAAGAALVASAVAGGVVTAAVALVAGVASVVAVEGVSGVDGGGLFMTTVTPLLVELSGTMGGVAEAVFVVVSAVVGGRGRRRLVGRRGITGSGRDESSRSRRDIRRWHLQAGEKFALLVIGRRRHGRAEDIELLLQHLRLQLEIVEFLLRQTLGHVAMGLLLQLAREDIAHDLVLALERLVLGAGGASGGELLVRSHEVGLSLVKLLLQVARGVLQRLVRFLRGGELVLRVLQLRLRHRQFVLRVGLEGFEFLQRRGQFCR